MRKYKFTIFLLILTTTIFLSLGHFRFTNKNKPIPDAKEDSQLRPAVLTIASINIPLENALSRITKKPFGIYVSPRSSPVSSEKFAGFHTGTDFENLIRKLKKMWL